MHISGFFNQDINKLKKIYFLYGEENFLIESFLEKFKEKYVDQNFPEFNFSFLKGDEKWSELPEKVMVPPFMYSRRIIIFQAEKIFRQKGEQDWSFLKRIPDTTVLIIHSLEEPNKKLKIFKTIKELGEILEFKKLVQRDIEKWIKDQFKQRGKKITGEGINLLKNSFNRNLQRLEQEIEKVCLFTDEKELVNREDILEVISRDLYFKDNLIFDLVDAAGNRRLRTALKILTEMNQSGESMMGILVMIARQFRLLLLTKELKAKGYSYYQAAKKLGEHPYPIKKCFQQGENFTCEQLEKGLEIILEANTDITSGKFSDDLALELALFKLDDL